MISPRNVELTSCAHVRVYDDMLPWFLQEKKQAKKEEAAAPPAEEGTQLFLPITSLCNNSLSS